MANEITANRIMHSTLRLNNDLCRVMGSDSFSATNDVVVGTNVSMSVLFTKEAHMASAFEQLSCRGEVLRPLVRQFWGGMMGQCADRNGLRWILVGPHGGGGDNTSCDREDGTGHAEKKARVDDA
jgi:uncharacterized glyoxalase superfamily protein PhnB